MRLLFVIDPPSHLKSHKDSTIALMRAAARWADAGEDIHIYATTAAGLCASEDGVLVRGEQWRMHDDHDKWYETIDASVWHASHFDAVLMRLEPPVDLRYKAAAMLLDKMQVPVFNSLSALLSLNEKVAILNFPQFIVPTIVSANLDDIVAFCQEHHGGVIKPLDGMGGQGIYVSPAADKNLRAVLDMLSGGGDFLMAQQYIAAATQGDARVFVIDGKVMDWMLVRQPRDDDYRSNLAAGGVGVAQPLSAAAREIGEEVGVFLKARGVLFAGLDIIGEHLTEINITCPTGLCEVYAQQGVDYSEDILRAMQKAVQ